ncbi:hypothetical protein AGIG_G6206 [Arapaima gigas]
MVSGDCDRDREGTLFSPQRRADRGPVVSSHSASHTLRGCGGLGSQVRSSRDSGCNAQVSFPAPEEEDSRGDGSQRVCSCSLHSSSCCAGIS